MWIIWAKEKGKWNKIMETSIMTQACKYADWFIEEGLYKAKNIPIMAEGYFPKDYL